MEMEKILKRIGYPTDFWVSNASFQLKDDTEFWWQGIERKYAGREHELTWDTFVRESHGKYYTAHARAQKKTELLSLKQGDMKIVAYDAKFSELSRFAPELVSTEEDKMFLFLKGMDPDLQVPVRGLKCLSLADMIERASDIEDGIQIQRDAGQKRPRETQTVSHGASTGSSFKKSKSRPTSSFTPSQTGSEQTRRPLCSRCGQRHSRGYRCDGHISPMCRARGTQSSGQRSQSVQSGSRGHGGSQFSQRQSSASEASVQKPQPASAQADRKGKGAATASERPLIPGRVYTLTQEEAEASPTVVQGILLIDSVPVRVLFDSGATHSFATPAFLLSLFVPVRPLAGNVLVSTPVGSAVELNQICCGCGVEVCGRKLPVDLIALEMRGFDVILGMDWLSTHHARLDCHGKRVYFSLPGEPGFVFDGDRPVRHACLISTLQESKMLMRGCEGFLAYVVETRTDEPRLEDIPVVCEFVDVFPEDLPGLPPDREVEFVIDLLPDMRPISKAPYRMAPVELKELNAQLQELLDKGFIRPSVSP
ncbi:hypothetical protein Dimus_039277 [Dionaea muscipula]